VQEFPLTLTMTIVAPWSVWQCSDYRVTILERRPNGRWKVRKREDDSVKHISIQCRDGAALLAYSGLAKVDDVHISDWVRRQIRGSSWSLDQTLIRIREAATAELAGPAKANDVVHVFVVGAYLQGRPWAVEISNTTGPPNFPILDRFESGGGRADEPKVMIAGEGRDAISAEDRALLLRVARRRPRRPEDIAQLLANIHRRAKHSGHPAGRSISEACFTSHMALSGPGVGGRVHWDTSGPDTWLPIAPMVYHGLDMTEIMRLLAEQGHEMRTGGPVDEAENRRRTEEALRRSVEPPNP
jgi:hypothetical protein